MIKLPPVKAAGAQVGEGEPVASNRATVLVAGMFTYAFLVWASDATYTDLGFGFSVLLIVVAGQLGGLRSSALAAGYVILFDALAAISAGDEVPLERVLLQVSIQLLVAVPLGHAQSTLRREQSIRREAEKTAQFLATHDPLTTLPSREVLEQRLASEMRRASQRNTELALMLVDLDRFRVINETLGRDAGDHILREVARRMQGALRATDFVGRIAGNRFVAMVPIQSSPRVLADLAEKILTAVEVPERVEAEEVRVTASVGIARFPEDGRDKGVLLGRAELALERAKTRGRRGIEIYDRTMAQPLEQRLSLERDLQSALAKGQMEVHYQPQVHLGTGEITGFEVLLRWRHPQRGFVPPAEFIPIAEDAGLIVPIEHWALEVASRQAVQWHQQGHRIGLAFNVSAVQLRQPDAAQRFSEILAKTGFDARFVTLELGEALFLHDDPRASAQRDGLRRLGVQLCIDDFGTGTSSLAYLAKLEVHTLKIDRLFVADICAKTGNEAIVRAIVAIARALELRVMAEGVENADQRALLAAIGVDELQGYLFGKPMPGPEATKRLEAGLGAELPVSVAVN